VDTTGSIFHLLSIIIKYSTDHKSMHQFYYKLINVFKSYFDTAHFLAIENYQRKKMLLVLVLL